MNTIEEFPWDQIKAFSKSISTKRPSIFLVSVRCIISLTRRVVSPIKRFCKKKSQFECQKWYQTKHGRNEFVTFSNILSIWAKNNRILNLILIKLQRIHGRFVVNACVKYRKKCSLVLEIFIRTDKIFKYFVN